MLNLCLSTDKEFSVKKILLAHAHTFSKIKGPKSYLIFYFGYYRLVLLSLNNVGFLQNKIKPIRGVIQHQIGSGCKGEGLAKVTQYSTDLI